MKDAIAYNLDGVAKITSNISSEENDVNNLLKDD